MVSRGAGGRKVGPVGVDRVPSSDRRTLMASGTYQYQSDFARRYVAQGEAQGEAKGEAKGRAHALLTVLATRGVEVPEPARERIVACADLEVLDRWLARAVSAMSVDEVVGE
jgi:hypothetical protein